jgi:hypothetical protein
MAASYTQRIRARQRSGHPKPCSQSNEVKICLQYCTEERSAHLQKSRRIGEQFGEQCRSTFARLRTFVQPHPGKSGRSRYRGAVDTLNVRVFVFNSLLQRASSPEGGLSIERMCQLTTASRGGFYRSLQERQPVEEEMEVRSAIQKIALEHRRDPNSSRIGATRGGNCPKSIFS